MPRRRRVRAPAPAPSALKSAAAPAAPALSGEDVRVIDRPRLRAASWRRVLLAHAPAGYGKTIMLRQIWAHLPEWAAKVWLTLTPAHRTLGHFLDDLGAVLKAEGLAAPDWCDCPEDGGSRLAKTLSVHDRPLFLAFDNYQAGASSDVDAFVRALAAMSGEQTRIAIAGRTRPSIGAAALAARGDLTLVRGRELRFTREETIAFFDGRLDVETAAALDVQAEGWPAALQLALRMIAGGRSPPRSAIRAAGGETGAFLAEETFEPLSDELRALLVETALLERLDPDDADYVRQRQDSAALLEQLEKSAALVFEDDEAAQLLRRHALLRGFVEARFALLPASRREALTERSAACLARKGALGAALAIARRTPGAAPRLSMLEAAPPEAFWTAEAIGQIAHEVADLSDESFAGAPRSAILRALAWYEADRVGEARAAIEASVGTLRKQVALDARAPGTEREARLWEGLSSALFDEPLGDVACAALAALARQAQPHEAMLPGHVAAVAALRAGRSEEARAFAHLPGEEGSSWAGMGAQRALTALYDAAPECAAEALEGGGDDDAALICSAWLRDERCEDRRDAQLPSLDAAPCLYGFSPEVFLERVRLALRAGGRGGSEDEVRGLVEAARGVAAGRCWTRVLTALGAEELDALARCGARTATLDACARQLAAAGGEQAPEVVLALAQHDVRRRAYAMARSKLVALLARPAIARRWRVRALVLEARAALALDALGDANSALGKFLELAKDGVMARSFHDGGQELWQPLMGLASKLATLDADNPKLDAVAELALAQPLFCGEAPLTPPSAQEAAMFGALRRKGARAEAARDLAMSENTMKYYLKRVFEKWGVNDWRVAMRVAERLSR